MSDYRWMASALCAQTDPDLFHPEGRGRTYRDARTICGRCPVQRQCRAHADRLRAETGDDIRGMWAEQTPRERQAAGEQAEAVTA